MSIIRRLTMVGIACVLASMTLGAQAPPKQAGGESKVTWYFYTVKWGLQDEFLDLFQRNHYPVLKAREKAGMFTAVRTYVPEFHGDGRADWTFAVELVVPPNAPTTPRPTRSSRSSIPIARRSIAKSSGASRSWPRTGTCR